MNSNQPNRSLSLQELNKKNKADLQAIYSEVFGDAADESLTKQQLIDAIVAAQPADVQPPVEDAAPEIEAPVASAPTGPFYGNKDDEKRFKLPKDWAKQVCVYQCQIEQMNGGVVEIPNTHQLQTYDPATYDKLSADAKGQPSFFSESKMKVVILHDPRA